MYLSIMIFVLFFCTDRMMSYAKIIVVPVIQSMNKCIEFKMTFVIYTYVYIFSLWTLKCK